MWLINDSHTGTDGASCTWKSFDNNQTTTELHQQPQYAFVDAVDSGDKPFRCSLCSYRTSIKSNLHRHIRIHTGEKPFTCPMCPYRSHEKPKLRRHLRTHRWARQVCCMYSIINSIFIRYDNIILQPIYHDSSNIKEVWDFFQPLTFWHETYWN